jgi:hypothetical protein
LIKSGKFYLFAEDTVNGLPGEELDVLDYNADLVFGFNQIPLTQKVRVDTGSFYFGYERKTYSRWLSVDSLDVDSTTYYQREDTTETGEDTLVWVRSDSVDAMIHVYLDTSMAKIPEDTTGLIASENMIADRFILGKNYPNPFNPVTSIPFIVPASAAGQDLKLEIFNVLGQKVVTLVDGKAEPGLNRISWDGTNRTGKQVSSGIYLYRLKTHDVTLTKRMLFIK